MFLFEGRIDVPDVCRSMFKRFKGSKVQNPNSNGVIKYSKIVILIYIIIYINIKYIILILNLFQNTI